ncbi:MAG: hypothetical protein UU15_C0007G0009 [Candidatus Levybacteria bacterium GW2011_GWC2_40_7]|nr:MAG: hypothetical protein UU15_C0007G0009 [Candidatus Levybacteria bacterium GW2011_GWC2_40_7]
MTKNPFVNAGAATAYIVLIACVMYYGTQYVRPGNSVMAPIAALSLFSLSAAVMGDIFLFQPLQLYLDGKKKVAVNLFLQTVAVFAGITTLILILFFSGSVY